DNPIFQRWWGRIAAKRGDYPLAANVFKDVLNKAENNLTGYNNPKVVREAVYYVGLQYKNLNQLDSSKYYFQKCVELSKQTDGDEESGFLINSVLYLGMVNDLQGNREEARQYYLQLLEMKEYGRSHTLAKNYLEKPYKD